jgi:hypothetical protein
MSQVNTSKSQYKVETHEVIEADRFFNDLSLRVHNVSYHSTAYKKSQSFAYNSLIKALKWTKEQNAADANVYCDITDALLSEGSHYIKAVFEIAEDQQVDDVLNEIDTASIIFQTQPDKIVGIWLVDQFPQTDTGALSNALYSSNRHCCKAFQVDKVLVPAPSSFFAGKEKYKVQFHRVNLSSLSPVEFVIANKLDIWVEPCSKEIITAKPTLPVDELPPLLGEVVENLSDAYSCPPDYVFAPLLTMIGALIGHRVHAQLHEKSEHILAPTFWTISVGDSGAGKSPAHLKLRELFKPINDEANAKFEDEMSRYAAKKEVNKLLLSEYRKKWKESIENINEEKNETRRQALLAKIEDDVLGRTEVLPEPTLTRYSTNRATYASLQKILGENEFGVLMDLEELKGLINHLSGARGAEYRSFLLESHSGFGLHDIDRLNTGTTHASNMLLSIFSTTQPAVLRPQINKTLRDTQDNDGLWQRFIFIYPEEQESYGEQTELNQDLWNELQQLFLALSREEYGFSRETTLKRRTKQVHPDAVNLYENWCERIHEIKADSNVRAVYSNYLIKLKPIVLKLAILFEIVDSFDFKSTSIKPFDFISEHSMNQATAIAEYIEEHARSIFEVESDIDRNNARTIRSRLDRLPSKFTVRQISQLNWTGIGRDSALVERALEVLESELVVRKLPKEGKTQYWRVNPLVRADIQHD